VGRRGRGRGAKYSSHTEDTSSKFGEKIIYIKY
jgi:hypothetical protein